MLCVRCACCAQVGRDNPSELKAQKLARSLTRGVIDRDLKPNTEERRRVAAVLRAPPNKPLSAEEQRLLWRFRFALQTEHRALPKFLQVGGWGGGGRWQGCLVRHTALPTFLQVCGCVGCCICLDTSVGLEPSYRACQMSRSTKASEPKHVHGCVCVEVPRRWQERVCAPAQVVDWRDGSEVRQAQELMSTWAAPTTAEALEMLSPTFRNIDEVRRDWAGRAQRGPQRLVRSRRSGVHTDARETPHMHASPAPAQRPPRATHEGRCASLARRCGATL